MFTEKCFIDIQHKELDVEKIMAYLTDVYDYEDSHIVNENENNFLICEDGKYYFSSSKPNELYMEVKDVNDSNIYLFFHIAALRDDNDFGQMFFYEELGIRKYFTCEYDTLKEQIGEDDDYKIETNFKNIHKCSVDEIIDFYNDYKGTGKCIDNTFG
jgi:hypothetical protein